MGKTGLPFGNLSRLLLAWVSTEAVRTQSRELFLGASLSEFMRKLGLAPVGGGSRGERTRVHKQMKRLFNAHIQLAYEDRQVSASVNPPLASRTEFWWNPKRPDEPMLWESRIELGEKFFQEGRVALPGGRCGDFLVDDPARKAMAHRLRSGCRARAGRGCLR